MGRPLLRKFNLMERVAAASFNLKASCHFQYMLVISPSAGEVHTVVTDQTDDLRIIGNSSKNQA